MSDIEIGNHTVADLHLWQGTQNLAAVNISIHGTNTATSRGIWAVEAADIFTPSNFTFTYGAISGSSGPAGTGTGAYLGGSNLTLQRLLVSGEGLVGVEVGDANFVIETVTFQGNGRSVQSSGAVRIGPSVLANSTVPAG